MARLEALFIALYPLAALPICLHALSLWWPDGHWLWLGVVLINTPILVLLGWLLVRGPVRGGACLSLATLCAWLGAVVTLLGTLSLGDPRPLAWLYAGLGLLGWCAYLLRLRHDAKGGDARYGPRPGQLLPALALHDLQGRPVSTTALRGAPAVLLFFRGNWSAVCMARVRELMRRRPQLERRGARIVLIGAQPPARTARLARRLDASLWWWSDAELVAARKLGIVDAGGTPPGLELFGHARDTVLPTTLIVDARGEIRYVDFVDDERQRPEPTTFLRVLDTMMPAPR